MSGHVLIVDDTPEMCDLFAEILELDDHRVVTALSVDAALRAEFGSAAGEREGPHVIFVDVDLAGGDVPSLTSAMNDRWPDAEVVYMVDEPQADLKRRLERGRVRHFTRPFQIDDLRDVVNGIVNRQARAGR